MSMVMLNSEIPSIFSQQQPFPEENLSRSYMHFFELANNRRKTYFASAADYDQGKLVGHWKVHDNQWVPVQEEVQVSFVFNKLDCNDPVHKKALDHAQEANIPLYGDPELGVFVSDKWKGYEVFHEYFALTDKIDAEKNIYEQIYQFFDRMDETYMQHDNKVILKPISGWQARGIHIVTREYGDLKLSHLFGQPIEEPHLVAHIFELFTQVPYIIQAYVNTQEGIPEIGLGKVIFHDARFVFYILEPGIAHFVQLYIKTPNGMVYYPVQKFPQEAFTVVEPVATKISEMFSHGIFSVDIMRDASGNWFLTELNDQIGFNIDWKYESDILNVTHLMQSFLDDMERYQKRLFFSE